MCCMKICNICESKNAKINIKARLCFKDKATKFCFSPIVILLVLKKNKT